MLNAENVKLGDCVQILGALEHFKDKTQVNIHRLRVVRGTN